MSLKRNIIASYATQIYVTLVGILILPLYLKYMGAEAYGLVGFFTMLQAWFNLLDMGLTPTVARETARFYGGATDALSYRRLLRALQLIFFAVALLGGGAMFMFSGGIADRWLNVQTLPLEQVQLALQLMAVGVALRWMSGLYRGCISGSERLVWLGGFNVFVATLRFAGVLPVLIWVGHSPTVFFTYQVLVAVIEVVGLGIKAHLLFPKILPHQKITFSTYLLFDALRPVVKYSLSIAFTSSAWVVVTQVDKLILSGILSLTEYGYFSLAVTLAAGVMTLSAPLTGPLTIRMIGLYSEDKKNEAIQLYQIATLSIVVFVGSVTIVLAMFSESILMTWTSDVKVALHGSEILSLYAIGYLFCSLSAFPGYIQHAIGDMKYHLQGSVILLVILLPCLVFGAYFYQAKGAAVAWASVNFLFFLFWTKISHDKLVPLLHSQWLFKRIVLPFLPAVLLAWCVKVLAGRLIGPTIHLWQIMLFGAVLILLMAFMAAPVRDKIKSIVWQKLV